MILGPENLLCSPTFESVAPFAEGFDVDRLAHLLTALALAAHEGRTLFLIDAAERLGTRVALLTFAFPEPLRPSLTFSTYHDRPEELPGFRLQGTIAAVRPNRAMLTSLGFIADLSAGTIEPKIEPARWAATLAGWFVRQSREDAAAWTDACLSRAAKAFPEPIETAWSDDRLNHLFEFHTHTRVIVAPPATADGWSTLTEFARWSGQVGLGAEWSSREARFGGPRR